MASSGNRTRGGKPYTGPGASIPSTPRRSTQADRTPSTVKGPSTKSHAVEPVKQPMDKFLLILTITLLGIGIVSVFDASYAVELRKQHSEFLLFGKQVRWAIVGLTAMLVAMRVPYWTWRRYAWPIMAASTLLLLAVLVPHVGHLMNGARRWIGPSILQLQPSEFAKLAVILYIAHICTAMGPKLKRPDRFVTVLGAVAVVCVLIAKEPDLGTSMVLFATAMTLLFAAGARRRHLATVLAVAAAGIVLFSITSPYRLHRLMAFANPKAYAQSNGYQVWHGLIAVGSGGFGGRGLGDGIEKIFIPMASTDFIFPVIAEEWGFIGSCVVIGLFLLVVARGFSIAHRTKDPFGALTATGITALIGFQSVINIAVATSTIPDTGVPLPFISYGGSALLLMMTSIGLLLNISRYPEGDGRSEASDGPPRPNERDFEKRHNRQSYLPKRNEDVTVDERRGGRSMSTLP